MMQVLLDTSCLFDLMDSPGRFSESERRALSTRGTTFHVSVISIREMRIKYHARHPPGHRKSHFSPVDVLKTVRRQNMRILHISANYAACPLEVPPDHKDPFDELLLFQALEEAEATHCRQDACRTSAGDQHGRTGSL